MHGSLRILDGDVFAGLEALAFEAERALVVVGRVALVIEDPVAAGAAHQSPDLVILARPEAAHAAEVSMLSPGVDVEPAARVEPRSWKNRCTSAGFL